MTMINARYRRKRIPRGPCSDGAYLHDYANFSVTLAATNRARLSTERKTSRSIR